MFNLVEELFDDSRPLLVVGDGDKGMTSALQDVKSTYENVFQLNDCLHKSWNLKQHVKNSDVEEHFWSMVRSPNTASYENTKAILLRTSTTLSQKKRKYINDRIIQQEKKLFSIALLKELDISKNDLVLYSYVGSQLSESMNAANKSIRFAGGSFRFCVLNLMLNLLEAGWGFVTQATLKKTAGPIPQN